VQDIMLEDNTTDRSVILNRIMFILSLLGIIMAIYVLQSFLRQSSILCLTGDGCSLVRKSPLSYPLGIPVPAVGLVGYTILTVLAFLRTTSDNPKLLMGIVGMALFGVVFVTWFTYTEVFLIKGICMWCGVSAVNMVTIFILAIKSYQLEKQKPRKYLED
jgi:uncharacterized membrane protein